MNYTFKEWSYKFFYSLFLLSFGILLSAKPVSAEETDIKVPTLAEGLDHKELSLKTEENADRSKWLSWFKGENLAVRTSFFGGRIRNSNDSYLDENVDVGQSLGSSTANDRFRFNGRTNWGGELGIGYKLRYGIELGISYMFMEINDYKGLVTMIDPLYTSRVPPLAPEWYNTVSMDIDSRAIMFNARVYLDELSGWDMGRFSPYIFAGAGRAKHKVTDHIQRDYPALNNNPAVQFYNFFTSHKNKGEFAYRVGMGTLFKLTDHFSVDASASFMDWGEARASRYYVNEGSGNITTEQKPMEPDVRTIQGSFGIQFNF